MAAKTTKISPFHLASLLRLEKNPNTALTLFQNPNPNHQLAKPFCYSLKSYDLIICKLAKSKQFLEMEKNLRQMLQETCFAPKEPLFCHVISIYGRSRLLDAAISMFDRIPRGCKTIKSFNSLVDALLGCGEFGRAMSLCNNLKSFNLEPDICTYNILIKSCGALQCMLDLFDEMRRKGIEPSIVTFGTLINGLCKELKVDKAIKLKNEMVRVYGLRPNVYIYTSLIKALCKVGNLDDALKIKNDMVELDSGVYSTIIRALFQAGRRDEVVGILDEMKRSGVKANVVTYNAMIAGFCDGMEFDSAFEAINEMKRNGISPDSVSYNTIILGFCKEKRWKDAVELFEDMPRRECKPDVLSYKVVFRGLCDGKEFGEARLVLDEMLFKGYLPGESALTKFVEGLCVNGKWDDIVEILCRLSRSKCFFDGWEMAVKSVMKDGEVDKVGGFVECLSLR